MNILKTPFSIKRNILALGAESEGVFAFYSGKREGLVFISNNFGDLLREDNFLSYKKEIEKLLRKERPDVILTDLHPLYNSTLYGEELAQKLKVPIIKVQHHLAHIFSSYGDYLLNSESKNLKSFIGIACDGTGYGLDGKIWGGEIFKFQSSNSKLQTLRIGHLENQILIGGDLAVKEPARMLISILAKISNLDKDFIYKFVKKFYNKNKFELLYNQLRQNFNCYESSSTGRILDAVSILLGFAKNQRGYKHEPIDLLEKNSTVSYQIEPKIIYEEKKNILLTLPLFEYLIKNLNKDKRRLAATAQVYIAKGLYKICQMLKVKSQIYFAGGIANNRIISLYLKSKGVYTNKKIPPGDPGISFGQIIYQISANPRD